MNINQRVQGLLNNSKLIQKELSTYISVAPSTLNNWIKLGRSIPSEYIIPICEFFGVSLEYLLTGKENACSLATIHANEKEQIKIKSIDAKEQRLLNAFRALPLEEQFCFIGKMEQVAENYNSAENVG